MPLDFSKFAEPAEVLDFSAFAIPVGGSESGNWSRGWQTGMGQFAPILKGAVGLAGATAEKVVGEGGRATGIKNWGLNGYQDGMEKLQPLQRENDDVTVAWEKAVDQGDLGAMVDFVTYAAGYGAAQMAQTLGMGIASGLAGGVASGGIGAAPAAVAGVTGRTAAQGFIKGLVEKEVARRVAKGATAQTATKALARDIGAISGLSAYSIAQEAGQIYPVAVEEAAKSGKELTGSDIARIWGSATVAGASETIPDVLGLGIIFGRFKGLTNQLGKTRAGRTATGAVAGGAIEAGQEAFQTIVEHYGAGQPLADEAGTKDIINAAAMALVPGVAFGGGVGFVSRRRLVTAAPKSPEQAAADVMASGPGIDDIVQTAAEKAAAPIRPIEQALSAVTPTISGETPISAPAETSPITEIPPLNVIGPSQQELDALNAFRREEKAQKQVAREAPEQIARQEAAKVEEQRAALVGASRQAVAESDARTLARGAVPTKLQIEMAAWLRANKPEVLRARLQEASRDRQIQAGLPSQIREGQEPVQAEPVQAGRSEAVATGRVLQAPRPDQQPVVIAPADIGRVSAAPIVGTSVQVPTSAVQKTPVSTKRVQAEKVDKVGIQLPTEGIRPVLERLIKLKREAQQAKIDIQPAIDKLKGVMDGTKTVKETAIWVREKAKKFAKVAGAENIVAALNDAHQQLSVPKAPAAPIQPVPVGAVQHAPEPVKAGVAKKPEIASKAQPVTAEPITAEAAHVEDGKIHEVTGEVIRESVAEGVKESGLTLTQQREFLLAEIDKAIAKAKTIEEIGSKYRKGRTIPILSSPEIGYVTFDVPGDGVFKVVNYRERLQKFRQQASAAFKRGPTPRPQPIAEWKKTPKGNAARLAELERENATELAAETIPQPAVPAKPEMPASPLAAFADAQIKAAQALKDAVEPEAAKPGAPEGQAVAPEPVQRPAPGVTEQINVYHAKTKGDFVGGKPSVNIGDDADILGKGFYFGTEAFVRDNYGEPQPYTLTGKFTTNQQWVDAIKRHSDIGLREGRAAARADLSAQGYVGVNAGRMGVVWDQSAFFEPAQKPAPSELAREPWQMTEEDYVEYRANAMRNDPTDPLYKTFLNYARLGRASEFERGQKGRFATEWFEANEKAAIAGKPVIRKPDWMMTRSEFDRVTGNVAEEHADMVKTALADGKPVPAEVLADYPDLKPEGGLPEAPSFVRTSRVRIDPDSLSREVLSKMDRALKAEGYDSRGADDVRMMLKSRISQDGFITHPDWIRAYERATESAEARISRKERAALEKSAAENVDWKRVRELGTTVNLREAGYITPIGSLIDLSGKREGGEPTTRALDHREVGGSLGMQEFMALGNIRMDYNAGTLDVAKLPTTEQLRQIRGFSDSRNGEIVIDLEDGLGEKRESYYLKPMRVFSREYPVGTKSARIVADIERFFAGQEPNALPQFARGQRAVGITEKTLRTEISKAFGPRTERMVGDILIPLQTQAEIAEQLPRVAEFVRENDIVQGFHFNGKTYIVMENIDAGMVRGMVMHEVGVHYGFEEMLGTERYAQVLRQMDTMRRAGNKAVIEAHAMASKQETRPDKIAGETLAYLVTYRQELPFVQRIISQIKAFLFREFGILGDRLTVDDIAALAHASVLRASESAQRGEPVFARAQNQTQTAAFRTWFGDSKVVDAEGRPLVVYHGTTRRKPKILSPKHAIETPGVVFLSSNEDVASTFTLPREYGETVYEDAAGREIKPGDIVAAYVKIENPLILSGDNAQRATDDTIFQGEMVRKAKELGHDGIILKNVREGIGETYAGDTYGIFNARQIKSATGNRGTFDPNNPDIRFARIQAEEITDADIRRVLGVAKQREIAQAYRNSGQQEAGVSLADFVKQSFPRDADKLIVPAAERPVARPEEQTDAVRALNAKILETEGIANAFQPTVFDDKGFADAYKNAFGVEVVYVAPIASRSENLPGIHYRGAVYINPNNPHHGFVQLAGHELLHQIKTDRPDLYSFLATAANKYRRPGAAEAYLERLESVGGFGVDVQEETLGDFVGDALADPAFLKALADNNPSRFRQLLDTVIAWLNDVASRLTKTGFGSSEYFTDVNALKDYLFAVLDAYKAGPTAIEDVAPPKFSRLIRAAGAEQPTYLNDTPAFVRSLSNIQDFLKTDRVLNRVISKVNTPFHISERFPQFRPVYDAAQAFYSDFSRLALQAADRAPGILPRVESFKDVLPAWMGGPKTVSNPDIQAVSRALYAGTLYGGGNPMEGLVWTDDELRGREQRDRPLPAQLRGHPLTDTQIALYRQALVSIGFSLDEHSKALIWRMARNLDIRLDNATSIDGMGKIAQDLAEEKIKDLQSNIERASKDPVDADRLERMRKEVQDLQEFKASVNTIENDTAALKAHGYFPAMRFGKYFVYVERIGKDGQRTQLSFELFEKESEKNAAKRVMEDRYPDAVVSSGTMNPDAYKLFNGLSLDALELFADHIQKAMGASVDIDPIMQTYFRMAAHERSMYAREIHRKGVPGYSTDIPRVLGSFTLSSARQASSVYHTADMLRGVQDIQEGDLQQYATNYIRYLQDPQEESPHVRGFLANYYILGSLAFGAINLTQPVTVTIPTLSQYTGYDHAAGLVTQAAKDAVRGREALTGKEQEDFDRATQEGVVSPQELHQIRAESQASMFGKSLAVKKALFAWGSIFSLTEQFNRRTSFIAGLRLATENLDILNDPELVKEGIKTPYDFAKNLVAETQFTYNRANRPEISRGPIGSVIMTFKQFTISYVELASRLYRNDKKAFAFLMLTLLVAAGLEGLPFAEDIEDVIDAVGQKLGYATNTKRTLRRLATDILGKDMGNILLHGVSAIPGVPLDFANRLGMGNILPGTAALKTSDPDKARDIVQIFGPAASIVDKLVLKGDMRAALPKAIQDLAKGYDMADMGLYRDYKGRTIEKADLADAFVKSVGFMPAHIAAASRLVYEKQQDVALHRVMEDAIASQWAQGIFEKDPAKVAEARQDLKDWNEQNPDLPIRIQMSQIVRRVRAMREPRETRFIRSAPPEIRRGMRSELREARP